MDIVELEKEHCSCICGGGDVVKDVVEAAAAISATVAITLLGDNIGAEKMQEEWDNFFVGTSTTIRVLANANTEIGKIL
eukprot:5453341-Ditylum_brightwellii.AAC.1